jgi:glycosyltransferase involved in cell wall biosynthesis
MRIAYDYQTFVLQSYGGISRYFTCLAQGLLELEQQVKIFAPLHRNSYVAALPVGIVEGHGVAKFPPKSTRILSVYNRLLAGQRIARWQPKIVHETYYSRFGSARNDCQTVITVYDMIHELFSEEFSSLDNTRTLKKIAIERADHVICISENTKRDLMRFHGTPENKITVIPLGFDEFKDEKNLSSTVPVNKKPFLLYVGSRVGYKNFSSFLEAIASSKRLLRDFDVVAFGGGKFLKAELTSIQSLGFIGDQVQQVNGNDAVLGQYYCAARAFIYPSLYEGFGIPPLEAMAHRCPVISSNTSSIPEVVGTAAEFFNPSSIEDMCRAIESVVYSDSRIDDLRKTGSSRLATFSWSKCSQATLKVYQSLI